MNYMKRTNFSKQMTTQTKLRMYNTASKTTLRYGSEILDLSKGHNDWKQHR